jgi:hypothetical protein
MGGPKALECGSLLPLSTQQLAAVILFGRDPAREASQVTILP